MRFVIGVVLALSVGIGAYLGSAQVADSAKTPPRKVTLRLGDIAAIGQIQCRAEQDGRSWDHLIIRDAFFACSKGPELDSSRAAQWVQVRPVAVRVFKEVGQVQCDLEAPIPPRHRAFFSTLLSCRGPHVRAFVTVRVLPWGGIAVFKKEKVVNR